MNEVQRNLIRTVVENHYCYSVAALVVLWVMRTSRSKKGLVQDHGQLCAEAKEKWKLNRMANVFSRA